MQGAFRQRFKALPFHCPVHRLCHIVCTILQTAGVDVLLQAIRAGPRHLTGDFCIIVSHKYYSVTRLRGEISKRSVRIEWRSRWRGTGWRGCGRRSGGDRRGGGRQTGPARRVPAQWPPVVPEPLLCQFPEVADRCLPSAHSIAHGAGACSADKITWRHGCAHKVINPEPTAASRISRTTLRAILRSRSKFEVSTPELSRAWTPASI